jgi:hypothetical protein
MPDCLACGAWLCAGRMAVLRRTHAATAAFVVFRWDAIERVSAGLLERGRLTVRQVRALARI